MFVEEDLQKCHLWTVIVTLNLAHKRMGILFGSTGLSAPGQEMAVHTFYFVKGSS